MSHEARPVDVGALTVGRLRHVIARTALPTVGMMACHFCFNLIDTIWVGRLIGPSALAAVSTAGFSIWVALSLAEMFDVGLVAVAARRHGAGSPEQAARVAGAAVWCAVGGGVLTALVAFAVIDHMFVFMQVPPDVARLGREYLATWLLGAPLVFGFFAVEAAFRAAGDTRRPFLILAGSVALNIAMDPLLISGAGPLPELGVRGAAVASVTVRGLAFLVGLVLALRRGLVRLDAAEWAAAPKILSIGAPISLSGVLLSLVYVWLTQYTARFGTPALAALGIGHKLEGLGFIAISGFAMAAAALVGQNLGAGREDRAGRAVWLTVGYCLVFTTLTASAFLVAPRTLAGLFTADAEVIADAALYLRVISMAQIGQSFELIFEGALAGAGYSVRPMIISTALTALRIPLSAWWSDVFGVLGIWMALSVTAVARGVAMTVLWVRGSWRISTI
jgi:putative MATE family efflux protein